MPKRTQLVPIKTQLVPKRRILVPKRKDFFKKREDFKYKGGPSVLYGCRKRQNRKCRKKCRNGWTPYFKYWPTEATRTQERPCVMNSILDLILQTLFQLVPMVTTENARIKFKSFLDSTISSPSTFTDFFLTKLIFSNTKTVVLGSFKMYFSIGVKRHLFFKLNSGNGAFNWD